MGLVYPSNPYFVVLSHHRSLVLFILVTCTLLAGCSNSSLGEALERSFAADPKLTETQSPTSTTTGDGNQTARQATVVQLPDDFPTVIPRYPGAVLQAVIPAQGASVDSSKVETRWHSLDAGDRILSFYRETFQKNNWQILNQPESTRATGTVVARRNDLNVTVSVQPDSPVAASRPGAGTAASAKAPNTELVIQYSRDTSQTRNTARPTSQKPGNDLSTLSPFSGTTALGASGDSSAAQSQPVSGDIPFTDLNKTPAELRQYVEDVAKLGILSPAVSQQKQNQSQGGSLFEPNKPITRREYARWLMAANNRLYSDRPTQQIRLAQTSAQPVFKDVPRTDPDFPAIQGLAEAGIIPSSLAGDPTITTFRPNDPLTRESMLLWKVPVDTRQALPTANIETVKQTWGFQDAAKIDPRALRAVLADYQNGDLSNIRRAYGYTTLFQPKKPVTRAEAAATLWYIGFQGEGKSAKGEGGKLKDKG